MFVRLYATAHPEAVAGLLLVDAWPERFPELLGRSSGPSTSRSPLQPTGLENIPDLETVDLGAASSLMLEATARSPLCRVPLVVGSDQRRVTIRFRNDDFRLTSVRPNRRAVLGKYDLGSERWRRKHSEYRTSLDAVQATPRGARLIFAFRAPNPN